MSVINEDLGKIFEKAICLLYNIDFDGNYKYSLEEAINLKNKIIGFKEIFPYELKHIAKNGNKYDFITNNNIYLSAKTTKKDGKICPQIIGQPTKKKFCEYFNISYIDNNDIKIYIIENIKNLLFNYFENTFDCPIIYYNKFKKHLLFIKRKEVINWNIYDINFSHIIKNKLWNESTSITINNNTIGEFQIHKNRDCIKFRWSFEKLLKLFSNNFEIIIIELQ